MARQSSSRLRTRAAALLAMASTASAMSLSNFQIITNSQVPLSCLVAYNTPILGCSDSDFTKGNACSAVCARGLQSVEDTVASICKGVTISSTTILGQVLSGNLVEKLCPSGTAAATTVSPPKSPQSTRSIGTFQPIPTQTTLRTSTTRSSSSSSSSTSSTSTAEDDADTETSTSSEPAAEPTENAQPTTQVVAPAPAPAPAVTNSPSMGQTTGAQQTKAAPPQTADDGSPGGGSPFDTIATVSSGASRQQLVVGVRWLEACLLANVFVFLLLR
ncbi:hypothetical protein GE09DRAFT_100439 [Coniochaeta sp. 2T2.1]|nr:hypothetical protein GE09DRAFT_100439 [Coniochaeta sp. 2T2.1]